MVESVRNLLQNQYDITHLTLGMLLHYLVKLKIQISANIQQVLKTMQTNSILSAPILR